MYPSCALWLVPPYSRCAEAGRSYEQTHRYLYLARFPSRFSAKCIWSLFCAKCVSLTERSLTFDVSVGGIGVLHGTHVYSSEIGRHHWQCEAPPTRPLSPMLAMPNCSDKSLDLRTITGMGNSDERWAIIECRLRTTWMVSLNIKHPFRWRIEISI